MKIDYDKAERRFHELPLGAASWAEDAGRNRVDPWDVSAVRFNKAGAVIKAIEEQTGRGRSTSRMFTTLEKRVS